MQLQDEAPSLSQAQLGIWLGHQRAEDCTVFHAAECVLLEGPLDPEAFERALDRTLAEASALHVVFRELAGKPARLASPYQGLQLERVQVRGGEDALVAHAQAVLRLPINLEQGPLFRHQLVQLGAERHAWLHVAHHIALDGYGFSLLARRVAELYGALLAGTTAPPSSFSSFDAVLRDDLAYQGSAKREEARSFWRDELGTRGAAALGPVPAPGHALRRRRSLSAQQVAGLRDEASRQGVTWLECMLALVAGRVGSLASTQSFVLGLPVMLRLGTSALRTPCMAMNIAPLPVDLAGSSPVQLARSLRTTLTRQRRHQSYRYEQLRVDRGPQAARSFGPVVNVLPFDLATQFGNCAARVLGISAGPVEDLSIAIAPRGPELELILDGHPALFDAARLDALGAQLQADVAAFLEAPERPFAAPAVAPEQVCLWPLTELYRHASARPHAPALACGAQVLSYAELARASQACAEWLVRTGVAPGDLVAVELPRTALAIVLLLGILRAGAGYVALDPAHPLSRRKAVLERARPRLTVISATSDLTFADQAAWCVQTDAQLGSWLRAELELLPPAPRTASDLAYVVFTSGSTGEPKGVAVGSQALASFVAAALRVYGWGPGDRVLQFAPLTFDASVEELFVALAAGATLVLRDDAALDSVEAFLASCERSLISVLDLPTAFWHELALGVAQRGLVLPPRLRQVIIGGEAASAARVQAWHEHVRNVQLLNTYGPSECTVVATCADLTHLRDDDVPIGRPLPGVQAVVCDEALVPVAPGVVGELLLLGATLARGYLGRDDLTRERFVELPGLGRAYRTGDLVARAASGELFYRGRVDDELKIAGHRIAPAEVEAALARHPEVRAVLVHGEALPDGSKRLVAHVEADAERLPVDALRAFVRGLLPAMMVPSRIVLHRSLARTAHGKLDRSFLRAAQPSGALVRSSDVSPLEVNILEAWHAVLGVEQVGLDDDFFALGGHSLQVIQLANRLSAAGREIRVSAIFRHPTPRKQAALLRGAEDQVGASAFRPWPVELPRSWFSGQRAAGGEVRVLLSGASGFVGAHLLQSLLRLTEHTVVCLVRGASDAQARARLFSQASGFGVDLRAWTSRIEVHACDLASATRGLLAESLAACASVFHCAAQVSLVRDYDSLVPSNVLATRELLGLAGLWGSAFHLVSSVATLPARESPAEALFPAHAGLRDGYQRSKWHAESLCGEASGHGLQVAIYRLGRVVGPRRRPVVHASDLIWRIARTAVRMGAFPELPFEEPWIPADEAADVMVRLALAGSAQAPAQAYHLVQTGNVRLDAFRAALVQTGHDLTTLPIATWMERVRARGDDEDRATLAFFELQASMAPHAGGPSAIPFARVRALLPDLDARPMDSALLETLCQKARESGLFDDGANDAHCKENGHENVQ